MKELDIEGKTIDEAIEKACEAFGVPREKLNIEILAESSSGFLGIGGRKARVRASLLTLDIEDDTFGDPRPDVAARRTVFPETPPEDKGGETQAQMARRLLDGILARMHFDVPVTVEESADRILLNIQGEGTGLLIGRQGQNIDALQYIVSKAVNRTGNGHKMIVIDAEAYRQRREESLMAMARRLGEKVKKTGKPVTVDDMNAHDRRIIHLTLQEDGEITTKSRGEGDFRKIVIMPSRRGPDRNRRA